MVVPNLEAALAHSPDPDETLVDVWHKLTASDAYQLWVRGDATFVTHLVQERAGLTLHFWLAAGTMAGCRALLPLAESFARDLGCVSMTLTGRVGWMRSFLTRDEQWAPQLVHLAKELA